MAENHLREVALLRTRNEEMQRILTRHQETISSRPEVLPDRVPSPVVRNEAKEAEELKELLLAQKKEADAEIEGRDAIISQLQALLQEKHTESLNTNKKNEDAIMQIHQGFTEQVQALESRLRAVEFERSELLLQTESLTKQSTALAEELERFKATGDMQGEEISRLTSSQQLYQGQPEVNVSQQSFKRVSEKLNELHLNYLEKQRELDVIRQEAEIIKDSLRREVDEQRREIQGLKQDRDIF